MDYLSDFTARYLVMKFFFIAVFAVTIFFAMYYVGGFIYGGALC